MPSMKLQPDFDHTGQYLIVSWNGCSFHHPNLMAGPRKRVWREFLATCLALACVGAGLWWWSGSPAPMMFCLGLILVVALAFAIVQYDWWCSDEFYYAVAKDSPFTKLPWVTI